MFVLNLLSDIVDSLSFGEVETKVNPVVSIIRSLSGIMFLDLIPCLLSLHYSKIAKMNRLYLYNIIILVLTIVTMIIEKRKNN